MQKLVIKLNLCDYNGIAQNKSVLIGVESIIRVKSEQREIKGLNVTEIESRHAMVTTTYVVETVEEVYNLINE